MCIRTTCFTAEGVSCHPIKNSSLPQLHHFFILITVGKRLFDNTKVKKAVLFREQDLVNNLTRNGF